MKFTVFKSFLEIYSFNVHIVHIELFSSTYLESGACHDLSLRHGCWTGISWDRVGIILLVIVVMITIIDLISGAVRKKLV
jgi:ABC-type phosphate/phosphonate transport system, permease component